jgi:hypothetical protein
MDVSSVTDVSVVPIASIFSVEMCRVEDYTSTLKIEATCISVTSETPLTSTRCKQPKVMKNIIFWDMTSCSPLSFNRRFAGTYLLHLQG